MRAVHRLNLSVLPLPNIRLHPWDKPISQEEKLKRRTALRMERAQRVWDAVSVGLAVFLLIGSFAVLVLR